MQAIKKQEKNKDTLAPTHSVFVAANAGSGKTRLLTDRVIALLLAGVQPGKILCLTFTNGAAAEMKSRITEALGRWVMMDGAALRNELLELTPEVNDDTILRARSLFATVLDAKVGLRLQTIHGFCQSLLSRFPLEAGVGTHLSVIDETTQNALIKEARMQLFAHAKDAGSEEGAALYNMVQQLGEHTLLKVLGEMVAQKRKLMRFIDGHHGTGLAIRHIYQTLGIAMNATIEQMKDTHLKCDDIHFAKLRQIAQVLQNTGKPTSIKTAAALLGWVERQFSEQALSEYSTRLLTDGRPRSQKDLYAKGSLSVEQEECLHAEQERMVQMMNALSALRDANFTASLIAIGTRLIEYYDKLKRTRGLMDFDDQILAATRLLSQSGMSSWVMYKLDGGIDHVLVDEAQDTSPEQWEIVRALTDEFFAGQGRSDNDRSIFVVGDEKQSIFRFQGADPTGLAVNRSHFMARLSDAAMPSQAVALTHSYRSAPEILQLVDKVFENEQARSGLSADGEAIAHQAKRQGDKGHCELWPLVEKDEYHSASTLLAKQIAAEITRLVAQGLQPGDVMVLVRKRSSFVYQLARALKRQGVPVAGVDRIKLLEDLAVQDLLAFAQVLLLPEDDLTLAALLRSPLFSISEDKLFELCHGRKKDPLWKRLGEDPDCKAVYELIAEFRSKVDLVSPFMLFAELLDARGYRRAFTGRMGMEYDEVLDVFLEQTLQFEKAAVISMQNFLAWISQGKSDIKRDMEHAGGLARIMTAHGAKGLQAKLVVVADTTSLSSNSDKMHWPEGMPLATSVSDEAGLAVQKAKEREAQLEMEEYRRLLYVALTRAEDMLIVCGAHNGTNKKTGVQEGSWYELVRPAFEALGAVQQDGRISFGERVIRIIERENAKAAKPFMLHAAAPAEEEPPRPLAPSHIVAAEPAAASPVIDSAHIQRGVAIHRMLQYLPALEAAKRQKVGMSLAITHAPQADHAKLVAEALRVMDEHEGIFGASSLAEVPVSGMVQWQGKKVRVLGQIDRLIVTEKEVMIIDLKSSARVPAVGAAPAAYLHQMALYAAVLKEIYPARTVRAGLLWTAIPRLDLLAPQILDEVPASAYI